MVSWVEENQQAHPKFIFSNNAPPGLDCVPETHEQMQHSELNPRQSSKKTQPLGTPDVNTCD